MQDIFAILKKHWGYDSFRDTQEEVIRSVLSGRDTLTLMPTGGGKSICFQVPALALGGLTVVITPLISLMKDQVDNLRSRGIKAVYLHNGMNRAEIRHAFERLHNGRISFLYVSPERVQNVNFRMELGRLGVRLLVVDEAHCISQWGYDFRPPYLRIGELRKYLPGVPVMALTASATPVVARDICDKLLLEDPAVHRRSFLRPNISYVVRESYDKDAQLLRILSATEGSAIVYVRSRQRTRLIAEMLERKGFSATYFHAGLDFEVKERRQNYWMQGRIRIIVATNAFGMGIDKPDVRTVVHYSMPPSLEDYYQESGRAGRDGLPSYAVLLHSRNDDAQLRRYITKHFPEKERIRKIYERVCNFLGIALGEGYGRLLQFDIHKFCETFGYEEQQVHAALVILGNSGYLEYLEEPMNRSRVLMLLERDEMYDMNVALSDNASRVLMSLMRNYGGLFADYTPIAETKLGTELNLATREVYEALLELSRQRVLSYIPLSRVPCIYVVTSREEPQYVQIPRSAYEERKEAALVRGKGMIDFASTASRCRASVILEYFGETPDGDCGCCDVCRKRKSPPRRRNFTQLVNDVYVFLSSAEFPVTINAFAERYRGKEDVLSALRHLMAEGFVVADNDGKLSTRKKA